MWLYSWDANDGFALVGIKQGVPALQIAYEPLPGYGLMALGSPYGLEGSVYSDGPLVNSPGRVVGTVAWSRIGKDSPQDWNVAEGIPLMCFALVSCDEDENWTWGYDIEN